MLEITNEHIEFVAGGVEPGRVLRDVQIARGKTRLLWGIDLCVEGYRGDRAIARILGGRPKWAIGPVVVDFASCTELLIHAARRGALALTRSDSGRTVVCRGASLDPRSGLLFVRIAGDEMLVAGEIVRGSFEVDGNRFQFGTVVARRSPAALVVPERLEEVPHSGLTEPPPPAEDDPIAEVGSPLGCLAEPRRLLDLSATRLSFDFDGSRERFPAGLALPEIRVRVDGAEVRVRGQVTRVRRLARDVMRCQVGLAPNSAERLALTSWAARSADRRQAAHAPDAASVQQIDDPARVRQILGALLRFASASVVARSSTGAGTPLARPVLDGDALQWPAPPPCPCDVQLSVCGSVYCFSLDVSSFKGPTRTSLPSSLLRIRQRWFRRVSIDEGAEVWFGGRAVADVSYGGLAFYVNPRAARIAPGTRLRDTYRDGTGRAARLEVEVTEVERRRGGRMLCHARALPRSPADERAWLAMVGGRLHPSTTTGAGWADALWRLYGEAGYFTLSGKTVGQFASLQRAFSQVSAKLDAHPELGCHVVYPSRAWGAAGALSVLKVYSRSWLGFQMAKVKGDTPEGIPGREVLRDLHLHAYEHVQRDPDVGWLIGYLQVKPVWSRLVHYDLPKRYVASGQACMMRFQAVEIPASADPAAPPEPDLGAPGREEVALLLSALARARPTAYLEALDLTPAQFDFGAHARSWHAAGLGRERATLVARRRGVPVAAAILESAEEGAHLFRLLDLVRLVPLGKGASELYPRLLRQAGRWFAARGKQSFVLLREEGTEVDLSLVEGAVDMGLADMSILSAALLPELLERVYEVTAPAEERDAAARPEPATPARIARASRGE